MWVRIGRFGWMPNKFPRLFEGSKPAPTWFFHFPCEAEVANPVLFLWLGKMYDQREIISISLWGWLCDCKSPDSSTALCWHRRHCGPGHATEAIDIALRASAFPIFNSIEGWMEMKWWRSDWFAWLIRWWICLLVKSSAGDWSPHMVFSCWRPPPQQPVLGSVIAARSQAAHSSLGGFLLTVSWPQVAAEVLPEERSASATSKGQTFEGEKRRQNETKRWDGKK